jgi:hypothetical protein
MTSIKRLRELAGFKEADQHTWNPDAAELEAERRANEEEQMASSDARADIEAQIERNIVYAFEKVGFELKKGYNLYFDDETTVEATIEYGIHGVELKKLLALSDSGLGSDFLVSPRGEYLVIRFTIDPNLAAGSPID